MPQLPAVCLRKGDVIEGPDGPEEIRRAYLMGGGLIGLELDSGTITPRANEQVPYHELRLWQDPEKPAKHDRPPRREE